MRPLVWIVGLVAVLLFGLLGFLWSMWRTYGRMFSVEHYREVAETLAEVRRAATQYPGGLSTDAHEPRRALTSRFVGLAYSIVEEGAGFDHHISVSTPQAGHTSHAAGQAFVSFFVWRLGLDPGPMQSILRARRISPRVRDS